MNNLTLESVVEAFRQWREKRSSRAEAIPEELWSMALGLYPQYIRSKICHHLRLSGSQFKRRLESHDDTSCMKGFVLASRNEIKEPILGTKIQLTMQGQSRSMTLFFDAYTLGQVLPHIGVLL